MGSFRNSKFSLNTFQKTCQKCFIWVLGDSPEVQHMSSTREAMGLIPGIPHLPPPQKKFYPFQNTIQIIQISLARFKLYNTLICNR
jgi:hypothetical protein